MARRWISATIVFALAIGGLTAAWIALDWRDVIAARREITLSLARLIAAHGEAAIGDAEKIVQVLDDSVAAWDLQEPATAHELMGRLQRLLVGSAHLSSGWVLNENGINVLDNWSYPPRPADGSDRPYFMKHKSGEGRAIISADPRPGSITGRERFTYSKAQLKPDGSLKSILVIGIYSHHFSALYKEAATWPNATAGFFTTDGEALAQLRGSDAAVPDFIKRILQEHPRSGSGSAVLEEQGRRRIVSWSYSVTYPQLFAATSQPLRAALADWRDRSLILTGVAVTMIGGFAWFAMVNTRMERTRQELAVKELAIREVHHRVKNGLQVMVAMIQMRARRQDNHAVKDELREIATRMHAVAQVHDLLQGAAKLDEIDANPLLNSLCSHLGQTYHGRIECKLGQSVAFNTDTGSTLAIIVNELLTNAMKHAQRWVRLETCLQEDEPDHKALVVRVSNDGVPLSKDFRLDNTARFGLRTALLLCEQIGASLSAAPDLQEGVAFTLIIPPEAARAEKPDLQAAVRRRRTWRQDRP